MVGEYQIEGKLGEGGFGAVYRSVHPVIGKPAAIKVLSPQFSGDPEMVSRFIAEARAVNQIRHRNIIDIFSFGTLEDGRSYYVMELLEGMTLDEYLKRKVRLSPAEAIPVLRQIARALDAAHAHGIAHRDLKPENIFLTFDDDGLPFPKLLDFGIAKLLGDTGAAHKTRTGVPIGTPYYMSPEQCRGINVDHRTDIYSFGVLAFELLTGRLPFNGESVMDVMLKQATAVPPLATSFCADLPQGIDEPLNRMLHKDPDKRPASVGLALETLASGAGLPSAPRSAEQEAMQAVTGTPKLTPSDLKALSEAGTLMGPPPGLAMDASRRGTGRSRLAIGVGAAILVAAGSVAAVVTMRPSAGSPSAAGLSSSAVVVASPDSAPLPSAAPSAAAKAPEQADVAFTVKSVPDGVEVWSGDEKLGTAPGPVRLPKGTDKLKLTFKAKGYKSSDLDVTPTADGTLSVTLTRVAAGGPAPKRRGGGELENPF